MWYFFKVFLDIDQETLLKWFGVEVENNNINFSDIDNQFSTPISIETLKLILEGLWQRAQGGLTLSDIENLLSLILFLRFLILAVRYNIKTSCYITAIGLFAGYLWYKHLIDLITIYKSVLINIPYLNKLGTTGFEITRQTRKFITRDIKLGENVHWYNPGELLYYAVTKGIVKINSETGTRYYIDPLSMIISNLKEIDKNKITPFYYKLYNEIIPQIFQACGYFWSELSGIASYALITRIGKRYCPYLVRWHWTFLVLIGFAEQILVFFIFRVFYFYSYVLMPEIKNLVFIPKKQILTKFINANLILQINFLNVLMTFLIILHIGFICFGLFHAIWGQYFYLPFFVENTELHVGPRPKNSIYSGGNTAWQDEKEKNIKRIIPRVWYGLFGSGKNFQLLAIARKLFNRLRSIF